MKFSFDIYKRGSIVFNGEIECESEKDCISKINKIKELAKDVNNYKEVVISDEPYIQLVDEKGNVYFSSHKSIALETNDREKIIKQVINKIPYCRVELSNHH